MLDKNDIRLENQELEGENTNNIIGQPTMIMSDTNITDDDLKYTPKSEFINNAEVLGVDDLLVMSEAEKVELLMKLQEQNLEVKKDNEQFRQQNFILLCKVRKMERMGVNDDE